MEATGKGTTDLRAFSELCNLLLWVSLVHAVLLGYRTHIIEKCTLELARSIVDTTDPPFRSRFTTNAAWMDFRADSDGSSCDSVVMLP